MKMHIDQLRNILKDQGEALLNLAGKLIESGKPLKEREKELIRLALVPAIKECQAMINSAFITGRADWLNDELERLHDLLDIAERN